MKPCVSQFFFLVIVSLLGSLHAEDKIPPDPAAHTVYIPFDQTKPVQGQKPQRYYLDRADFDRLWSLAKENRKPEKILVADDAKPEAVLQSALYRAVIEDERLVIEAQYDVTSRGHWAKIRVGLANAGWGESLPLRSLMVDGKPGSMSNGEVAFEQPGEHRVQASFDLVRERHWKTAAMSLPPARAATLSLTLADQDAMPRFADAKLVAVEETLNNTRTITVGLGSADSLNFDRIQRRPVSAALPPSAELNLTTGLTGEMRLHASLRARFAFPGASHKEAALLIDPDWIVDAAPVVSSAGQIVREVRVSLGSEAGRQLLVAAFPHEVSDEVMLDVQLTPKGLNPLHTPFVAPKAGRWETTARLIAQDGVQIIAKPTASQQRMANEEYQHLPVVRYRLGATDTLAIDLKPADAKTEARIDYVYQLSEQKQELAAAIALKRERGAWRQLRVSLSPGMEIQSVQSPNVIAWEMQGNELFLRFNDLTGAEARVVILVASTVLKASKNWTLTPLKLADIEKVKGTAIVAAHAATEARLDGFKQEHDLREVDPANLTATFTITAPLEKKRAIEFERPAWTLNVSLQDLPTRFSADGILLLQATDLGVLVSQQISLNVEQGALKRLILRLPKALPEATVTGEQLREVQSRLVGNLREYECTFQSQGGLLGQTALTFEMQLPLTDAELSVPFVEITDVERLRRYFVLDNSSSREAKTLQADGVDACAKDALPYVPEVLTQPQFYQGRSNGGLKVAYTQLQATSGNAAIVTLADITTVLRADGERWDTVIYSLSNRSLQFLPVVLPDKAELMAVTVGGEAVRADEEKRNGQRVRLIPLIQTRPGERSMEIKLVYRIRGATLGKHIKLDDPDLVGISAERTVWTASVPKGWTIDDTLRDTFGNMEPIAEEGRDIEKLQSWMSDLGRINRAVSSSKDALFNRAAIYEADKLNQQIDEVTKQVESKSKSRFLFREGGDNSKLSQKFASQVEGELSEVKKELGRQVAVLSDNKISQPIFSKRQTLGNSWAMNGSQDLAFQSKSKANVNQGYTEYRAQLEQAKRLAKDAENPVLPQNERARVQASAAAQTQKAQAMEQELRRQSTATLGLNDNVAVNNNFFSGGLTLNGGILVLGGVNTYTGGTTVNAGNALPEVSPLGGAFSPGANNGSGAGSWTIANGNTYTGSTTVSGGVLQVNNGTSFTGGITKSGAGSLTLGAGNSVSGDMTGNDLFKSKISGTGGRAQEGAGAVALDMAGSISSNSSFGGNLTTSNVSTAPVFSNGAGIPNQNPFALNSNARAYNNVQGQVANAPAVDLNGSNNQLGTLNVSSGNSLAQDKDAFGAVTLNSVSPQQQGIIGGWGNVQTGAGNSYDGRGALSNSAAFAGTISGRASGSWGSPGRTVTVQSDSIDGMLSPPKPAMPGNSSAEAIITAGASEARKQMGAQAGAPESPPAVAMASPAPATPTASVTFGKATAGIDPFGMPAEPAAKEQAKREDLDRGLLTTQAVNQLRPTGRRSLQVEVPLTGEVFHFRKLKDHAVLDLPLKRPWQEGKASQATVFGFGLGIWGLLALFSARRRRRVAAI